MFTHKSQDDVQTGYPAAQTPPPPPPPPYQQPQQGRAATAQPTQHAQHGARELPVCRSCRRPFTRHPTANSSTAQYYRCQDCCKVKLENFCCIQ
jgi:hypothetical protein